MSDVLQDQSSASSRPSVADLNMHALACSTDESLLQGPDPEQISKNGLEAPSLQMYSASFNGHGAHTSNSSKSSGPLEENGMQSTTRNSKRLLVKNASSEMLSEVQSLEHDNPSTLPVHESTAAVQIPAATQLLLTHDTGKEVTSVQQPSAHTSNSSKSSGPLGENGMQSTTRNSKRLLVKNASSEMLSEVQSLEHDTPSTLPVHQSTAAVQIPAAIQLLLTHDTGKEVTSVQQPSKEIVKISTEKDENKNSENIDEVKVLPCVGAFTIQCAKCMKWRLIPTKEQYEDIRQSVLENPFFCSSAVRWRPNVSCEDPSDVTQDEKHLWAIDRPNIPLAPAGWERQLVIRAAGASKFADVYYVAPSGRKLRSMPEVERFLSEFPEYIRDGVRHSQFSFIIPKPLDANYCRKKTTSNSALNENQRKSKREQAQVKKSSVKRKAFESLSFNEDPDEQEEHKKSVGVAMSSEIGQNSGSSIIEQVARASLPKHGSLLGASGAASDGDQSETVVNKNL